MTENTPSTSSQEARDKALFDRIAEAYGRKDLEAPSRRARRQRLMQTLAALPVNLGEQELLEAGCGAGFSADYLDGACKSLTGIDYSEGLIDLAQGQAFPGANQFEVANIKEYAPGRSFDVIFMIGVIHHIDDPLPAMRNLVSLLRPGGWLVANEPQPGNPLVHRMRRARKRMDRDYSDEQLELSFDAMRSLYSEAGLTGIRCRAQGLFSTPFAEVVLKPSWLMTPLAHLTCGLDSLLETLPFGLLRHLSWNAVVAGQRPG